MALIGISGKIGSGKDTVGQIIQYLTDELNKANPKEFTEWVEGGFHTSDWEIKKFAGKLKQIASILTGATLEQLEDQDFKKLDIGSDWGMTYRELLQKLGTEAMRNGLHTNVWVNALMADYHLTPNKSMDELFNEHFLNNKSEIHYKLPNWVITDMRFPNEMDAVKARDGITIRVNRPLKQWHRTCLDCKTGFDLENKPAINHTCPKCNSVNHAAVFYENSKHLSEISLDGAKFDYIIENNSSIEDLVSKVRQILVSSNIL